MLGFIGRSIKSRSAEVILKYVALVRLHFDYVVQFWSPYGYNFVRVSAEKDDQNDRRDS